MSNKDQSFDNENKHQNNFKHSSKRKKTGNTSNNMINRGGNTAREISLDKTSDESTNITCGLSKESELLNSKYQKNSPYSFKVKKKDNKNYSYESVDYEVDVDAINVGTEKRTTCMLKNIPNKYSYDDIIGILNTSLKDRFNFVYLILNFHNDQNAGYAFINFVDVSDLAVFYTQVHNTRWRGSESKKLAEVKFAHIQGIKDLLLKLKSSSVLIQDKKYWPRLYLTGYESAEDRVNILTDMTK